MVKTINEVLDASKRVANYIQTNKKTPLTVTVGGLTITRPSFNRMLAATILEIHNKTHQKIRTDTIKDPSQPQGGLKEGKLQKTDYIDAAKRTYLYIESKKQMPNYINTKIGVMSPFNFMDMYSRALNFYASTKELPAFIYTNSMANTVPPTSSTPSVPSNLKNYLLSSANCQVTNSRIVSTANSLRKSTILETAKSIFNYVRDTKGYEYYYNTRNGAVGTLTTGKGNCCDLSHLAVALLRAAGIPARYRHVHSKFTNITCGHVVAQAYVDGTWYNLDASNNGNGWNVIGGTVLETYGYYQSLPF